MMNKTTVLFVDDEERIVRVLGVLFRTQPQYNVLTATSAKAALKLFDEQDIHVIVSDQRMPEMTGVEFLSQAQQKSPNSIRILLTGYADLDAIVDSINEGEIYRYITKPWQNENLLEIVAQASQLAKLLFKPHYASAPVPAKISIPTVTAEIDITKIEVDTSVTDGYGILIYHSNKHQISQKVAGLFAKNPLYATEHLKQVMQLLSRALSEKKDISVVVLEISDETTDLISLIKGIKKINAALLCIVITKYTDANTVISLINGGLVYRYLPLPAKDGRLQVSINSALNHAKTLKDHPEYKKLHAVEGGSDMQGNKSQKSGIFSSLFAIFR